MSAAPPNLPVLDLSATEKPPSRKNSISSKIGTSFKKLVTPRGTTSNEGTPKSTTSAGKSIFAKDVSIPQPSTADLESTVTEAVADAKQEVSATADSATEVVSGTIGKMEMPAEVSKTKTEGPAKENLVKIAIGAAAVVMIGVLAGTLGGKKKEEPLPVVPPKKKGFW